MNYYRRFPGDYLRDTRQLTLLQHGVYNLLLDQLYATEERIPTVQDAVRICQATTVDEQSAVIEILAKFFKKTTVGFTNNRFEKELKTRKDWCKRQKTKRDRERDIPRDGHGQFTVSPFPSPSPLKERENLKTFPQQKTLGGSIEFRAFWDAYPRKLDKREAVRAWVKGTCDGFLGEILASLESWKRCEQWLDPERIPYPATWLNKQRWKEVPNGAARRETLHEQLERIGAKP